MADDIYHYGSDYVLDVSVVKMTTVLNGSERVVNGILDVRNCSHYVVNNECVMNSGTCESTQS